MHTPQPVGQIITCTNYPTDRFVDCNPEPLREAALKIDVPRQHPPPEVLCATLYLRTMHGVRTTQPRPYQEFVGRVFPPWRSKP
ncbi:MAG: hypothetical protein OXC12_07640 [Spirochaetaceae bacterium]|nr:hypothetical protein [Spirochaetaceae bacterium]